MAEGAANNILDIGFNPIRQRQALKGQQKSLELQNAAALDLWNKTNYGAQMERLKSAGLNPGLIYGMGGAGGQLGGNSGNVNTQQSDPGSMGMGIQAAMAQAQIEAQREQEKFNQARILSEADRAQEMELFKLQQEAAQQQQAARSQAMMDPQILDYLQKTMTMPPGAARDALMANLEQITGKTYQRPVDQFQQLLNPNKIS